MTGIYMLRNIHRSNPFRREQYGGLLINVVMWIVESRCL